MGHKMNKKNGRGGDVIKILAAEREMKTKVPRNVQKIRVQIYR